MTVYTDNFAVTDTPELARKGRKGNSLNHKSIEVQGSLCVWSQNSSFLWSPEKLA